MASDDFERPVVILTELGHPAAIASAMQAYMFLADWLMSRRDAVHGFAVKACGNPRRDRSGYGARPVRVMGGKA